MLEIAKPIRYHSGFAFQGKPVSFTGLPRAWQPIRRLGFAMALATALGLMAGEGAAKERGVDGGRGGVHGTVRLADLPPEAQATDRLISAGGPFPYTKDGIVFGNRERVLPARSRGFYREYTVRTRGTRDRGAKRIVCGGQPPTRPEACYYTDDHYASFRRIAQ